MIVFGIILIVLGLLLPSLVPTFAFAHICVVIGVILLVGMGQDYAIGLIRNLTCPYATLTLERR